VRSLSVLIPTALAALALTACGSEGVSVPADETVAREGAEIFATHCSGCHTLSAAGTQGSGNRNLRVQGPNFDQRAETYEDALFAIHNGGFSGAIMPQNIVVGEEAEAVAEFLAEYSGTDVDEPPRPSTDDEPAESADEEQIPGDPTGGSGSNSNTGG
jgi:mono/diheme cytochrome c family protein